MTIETLEVSGVFPALHGMRNPMNSWDRMDSVLRIDTDGPCMMIKEFRVGPEDRKLSIRLQKAGPEHCKHLRMVNVYADITAPRYWWTEFDTYRAGVEKVSCSTMHKLMSRELTVYDFETDNFNGPYMELTVDRLNALMKMYADEEDPDTKKLMWRKLIQYLPQSYLQKRTVMMSYAALRNIYRQREGHKLREWEQFREWVRSLPESWMITE